MASSPPVHLLRLGEGGHTRLREGWGSPNSDQGTNTVVPVLCFGIYRMYFVYKMYNSEHKLLVVFD
jgi:hypothetical protein